MSKSIFTIPLASTLALAKANAKIDRAFSKANRVLNAATAKEEIGVSLRVMVE